jgi:hypothetical protein
MLLINKKANEKTDEMKNIFIKTSIEACFTSTARSKGWWQQSVSQAKSPVVISPGRGRNGFAVFMNNFLLAVGPRRVGAAHGGT